MRSTILITLLLGISWLAASPGAVAQQDRSRIEISSSEVGSPPNIILRAFAVDTNGQPLILDSDNITVSHNGEVVSDAQVIGDYQAGTFTIFVVDVPGGLEGQLQSIQDTVEEFSNPPYMEERADYVALYRVGPTDAEQLLTPANFYNTIQNYFFGTPLTPSSGRTALADSMGNLLSSVSRLKPKEDMATSIVLITDGTDAVSKTFELDVLSILASDLEIPIHTIWIRNEELPNITVQEGRDYLAQLANQTGGIAAHLDQSEGFAAIWNQIAGFRNHQVIEYRPENIKGGVNEIILSLPGRPGIEASTEISIPETAPSVEIILPDESREIRLESLEDPVRLSFSAAVTWLDDIHRTISSAEILVNRIPVQQIPIDELERFTSEISYFAYGPNDIQVKIEDELGQTATSPVVTLSVVEGQKFVPEEMRPSGITDLAAFRVGLLCLALLGVLAILALVTVLLRRFGVRGKLRRSADRSSPSTSDDDGQGAGPPDLEMQARDFRGGQGAAEQFTGEGQAPPSNSPYLVVLSSVTRIPGAIGLSAVEHHVGRSPVLADIVLENDITVSRLHASIILEGTDYRIYDEGSSSGTWVNNQQIPDFGQQLQDGDEIRLGDAWLQYRR